MMFTKHLLFLNNQQLVATFWRGARALSEESFETGREGHERFAAYLARSRKSPAYMLIDLIEEDFRTDTIPHLHGNDRNAVLERKLGQVFRGTPYRHALIQGRDDEGRRDDRVLYTAIPNAELIKPWVDALAAALMPLAGIYSAPIVSAHFLKAMQIDTPHSLLVTMEPAVGLRQSYFQRGEIRFSRLTPVGELASGQLAAFINEEVSRTWQYLDSLRYFPRTEGLDAYVVCDPLDAANFQSVWTSTQQSRFHALDIRALAASLGLKQAPHDLKPSTLLLYLVASRKPHNHFASRAQMRLMALWRTRIALAAASIAALASGAAVCASNVYEAVARAQAIARTDRETQALMDHYRAIARHFPATPVAADAMRDSVNLYNSALRDAPTPAPLLLKLGNVLMRHPKIELKQVAWIASADPNAMPLYNPVSEPPGAGVRSVRPASAIAPVVQIAPTAGAKMVEIAVVEGAVVPFNHDYRAAIEEVRRLLSALSAIPGLRATPLTLPLDVSSQAVLQGKSGAAPAGKAAQAAFALKLIWSPP